jgi:hypothetical protein
VQLRFLQSILWWRFIRSGSATPVQPCPQGLALNQQVVYVYIAVLVPFCIEKIYVSISIFQHTNSSY